MAITEPRRDRRFVFHHCFFLVKLSTNIFFSFGETENAIGTTWDFRRRQAFIVQLERELASSSRRQLELIAFFFERQFFVSLHMVLVWDHIWSWHLMQFNPNNRLRQPSELERRVEVWNSVVCFLQLHSMRRKVDLANSPLQNHFLNHMLTSNWRCCVNT